MVDEVKNNRCPSCGGILVLKTTTRSAGNRFQRKNKELLKLIKTRSFKNLSSIYIIIKAL